MSMTATIRLTSSCFAKWKTNYCAGASRTIAGIRGGEWGFGYVRIVSEKRVTERNSSKHVIYATCIAASKAPAAVRRAPWRIDRTCTFGHSVHPYTAVASPAETGRQTETNSLISG